MRLSSHKVTFRMRFSISKKERLSSPSFLREVKRQSSASSEQVTFSGKIVSMVIHCASQQPLHLNECLITRIAKAAMIASLRDQPKFSELFIADLVSRNGRIEEDLIDQLFNSSEKRLARALLLLANFGKEGGPAPIVGKFSQEILAKMIGTTRSRVGHFMNKFRKLVYIKYNGDLEIHNSLLNIVLYDKPEIKRERSSLGGEGR